MGVANLNIELQRNSSYIRHWTFRDAAGDAIDITNAVFRMEVKYNAGLPDPALASATFEIIDAGGGVVQVSLLGADFDEVPGEQELVRLAYDCIAEQDGDEFPVLRGAILLLPGVS